MALNVKLLEKVKAHILEEPKRMDMDRWKERLEDYGVYDPEVMEEQRPRFPKCNTVGCIAGWADMLSRKKIEYAQDSIESCAHQKLGIDYENSGELFYTSDWPEKFSARLEATTVGTKAYARVVAARIDDFIKQYGPKPKKAK